MSKIENITVVSNTYGKDEINEVQKITKIIPVDYKQFDPFKFQSLIKKGNVNEIEESIKKIGLLEPIVAVDNNGRYEILSGHTRYEALANIIESNEFNGYKYQGKTLYKEIPVEILSNVDETTKLRIFYDSNVTQRELSRDEKRELAKKWAELILNPDSNIAIKNKKKYISQKANISEKTAQTIINEIKGKKEEKSEIEIFVNKLSASSRTIRNQKFNSLTVADKNKIKMSLTELEQEIIDLKRRCQV